MAWEWAVPVATGAVGLAGIVATYLSGKRQATSARQLASEQAAAALAAQREERNQRRIEAAYPELLDALSEGAEWLWKVDGFMTGDTNDVKPPEQPKNVLNMPQRGAHPATWSPHVAKLADEWSTAAGTAATRAKHMGYMWEDEEVRTKPDRLEPPERFERLTESRRVDYLDARFRLAHSKARTAEARIREQVWRELRSEDEGYLPPAASGSPGVAKSVQRRWWRFGR